MCVQSVELRCHPVAGGTGTGGDILLFESAIQARVDGINFAFAAPSTGGRRRTCIHCARENLSQTKVLRRNGYGSTCARITSFIWATHTATTTHRKIV